MPKQEGQVPAAERSQRERVPLLSDGIAGRVSDWDSRLAFDLKFEQKYSAQKASQDQTPEQAKASKRSQARQKSLPVGARVRLNSSP